MARKTLLTPELIEKISRYIAGGVWDYVAAEAVGVSQSTFYGWLTDAQVENPDPLKVQFSEAVTEAKAKARASAELRVMSEKPDVWLLKGPGRHKPGRDGWSTESVITGNLGQQKLEVIFSHDGIDDPN